MRLAIQNMVNEVTFCMARRTSVVGGIGVEIGIEIMKARLKFRAQRVVNTAGHPVFDFMPYFQ